MTHSDSRLLRLHERHVRRLAEADPWVRVGPPTNETEVAEVLWSDDGEAAAVVDLQRTDPTSTTSLWLATEVWRVRLRAATDAAAHAAAPLLRRAVAEAPAGLEVHLTAASRDLAGLLPLLEAGFAPDTVAAVRRLDRSARHPAADVPPGVSVRPAAAEDLEDLVTARVALHAFEARIGLSPQHAGAAALLRAEAEEDLRDRAGASWVAVREDRVVGICDVTPPADAAWVAGVVALDGPVGYLKNLHVTSAARGSGVGTALVAAGHAALAAHGTETVVLHHGASNPLSTPFWYRAGYRPLLTSWVRQPRVAPGGR